MNYPDVVYTSRSQFEATQSCKRKGFYTYRVQMKGMESPGLQGRKISIPLLTGTCVHMGMEILLRGGKIKEDLAVEFALHYFMASIVDGNLVIAPKDGDLIITDEVYEFTIRQEMALIEGLLRMYARRGVDQIFSNYEVLEVEMEGVPIMLDSQMGNLPELDWQYRTDALLLNKNTGELALQSTKTNAQWGKLQKMQYQVDNQGLSEAWSMERQFEAWESDEVTKVPEWYLSKYKSKSVPQISYTLMNILIKGQRREDKLVPGKYNQNSPLIRGYVNHSGIEPQYAWSWNVPRVGKDGSEYEGNIGSTFKSFNVWEEFEGGVKGWIDLLDQGYIQNECGDALGKQLVIAEPMTRNQFEKSSWARQMMEQEIGENNRAHQLNQILNDPLISPGSKLGMLDKLMPQTRKACVEYGGWCPWKDGVCFNPQRSIDPWSGGEWRERKNHHEIEEE